MKRLPDTEFQVDVFRSGINAPVSVRVTHLPTGVSASDESRSQLESTTLARGRAEERAVEALSDPPARRLSV